MINSGQRETVPGIVAASGHYHDPPFDEVWNHPQKESGGALCGVLHQNDSGDSNFVNGLLVESGHFLGAKDQHYFPPPKKWENPNENIISKLKESFKNCVHKLAKSVIYLSVLARRACFGPNISW
jgi:hypothetical protein